MTGETPLRLGTLGRVPASARPLVPPGDLDVGVLHLGLGAFHRAHQAVYTEEAIALSGDHRWGIAAASTRSRDLADRLAAQDGLYSVLVRDPRTRDGGTGTEVRVNGALREVMHGADLIPRIADPRIKVITITVTEKGYSAGQAPVPWLVAGLARRAAAGAGPVTVLSCDNVPANGTVVRDAVTAILTGDPGRTGNAVWTGERLLEWVGANVAFPSSMVDRLVPTPTPEDLAEAARLLGVADRAAVATEPFRQWVIENRFAADRPAWEKAGALIVPDVAPYELMKLRLLNGSHSLIAYLGLLHGCETIAEAVERDDVAEAVHGLMDRDVTPTLPVPDGFDLEGYKRRLLTRFANPALRHRTAQVASDGSQKLPLRLLPVIRERLAAGAEPAYAALAVAAWMRWVVIAPALDDPIADRLKAAVTDSRGPRAVVKALLPLLTADHSPIVEDLLADRLAALT
jgi:fructuronate reductase